MRSVVKVAFRHFYTIVFTSVTNNKKRVYSTVFISIVGNDVTFRMHPSAS